MAAPKIGGPMQPHIARCNAIDVIRWFNLVDVAEEGVSDRLPCDDDRNRRRHLTRLFHVTIVHNVMRSADVA